MNKRRGLSRNQVAVGAATTNDTGVVRLASKDNVNIPSNNVVTTDALTAWDGILKIATPEEVNEGVKDDCAVTPKSLANWKYAHVATPEEVLLGEDDTKAVTPKTLNAFFGGEPNLLLATDFEFNPMQLGTVVNAPKNGLLADRVIHDFSGTLESTSEIVEIPPMELAGKEVTKALRISFQGGNTVTYWKLKLPIKGVRGGKHALSIAIKGSADVKMTPIANQWFNASDGGDNAVLNSGFSNSFDVTTSMQLLTATIDLPSIEGKKVGKNNHLMIELQIAMPPTDLSLVIPFIKFEEGEVATDMPKTNVFETRQECMQYQQIIRSATGLFYSDTSAKLLYSTQLPFMGEPDLTIFDEHGIGMQLASAGFNDVTTVDKPILEQNFNDGLQFIVNRKGSPSSFQLPCMLLSTGLGTPFIQARYEFPED